MFTVQVDDNFHYMDESHRYRLGEFADYAAAESAARRIVDEFLESSYKPGVTAEALYHHYVAFGEDPFISPTPPGTPRFSAWTYAKQRCEDIVNGL